MSFGGGGSSYQWQEGQQGRVAPRVLKPMYDMMTRGIIGQMARPPETAISVPLQQAVSNLQSGRYDAGGSLVERLAGGAAGGAGAGFPQGSLLPNAPGGQQGLQTREQLGLPPRESYFTFMPKPEDIANIGLSPVRSSIKQKEQLEKRIGKLEARRDVRAAAGKPTTGVETKLAKTKERLRKNTGDLYL